MSRHAAGAPALARIAAQLETQARYRDVVQTELGLKPQDLKVLACLAKHAERCPCQQVREAVEMNGPRFSESLRRLCAQGFLETRASRDDRRRVSVGISDCGRDALSYAESLLPRFPVAEGRWRALQAALRAHDDLDVRSFQILLALRGEYTKSRPSEQASVRHGAQPSEPKAPRPKTQAELVACARVPQSSAAKRLAELLCKGLVASVAKGAAPKAGSRGCAYCLTSEGEIIIEDILSQVN